MERSLAILAIALGIHVAGVSLLLVKYFETRFRYVTWWTAGAAMLTARAAVELWMLAVTPAEVPSLVAMRSALLLAGAGFFLTGAASRDPAVGASSRSGSWVSVASCTPRSSSC